MKFLLLLKNFLKKQNFSTEFLFCGKTLLFPKFFESDKKFHETSLCNILRNLFEKPQLNVSDFWALKEPSYPGGLWVYQKILPTRTLGTEHRQKILILPLLISFFDEKQREANITMGFKIAVRRSCTFAAFWVFFYLNKSFNDDKSFWPIQKILKILKISRNFKVCIIL